MNEHDSMGFCKTMSQQVGIPLNNIIEALPFWRKNLANISTESALEGLKVLMMNGGPVGKDPGKWLAAVVRYSGSPVSNANAPRIAQDAPQGCERCRHSGTIEVPSLKDWDDFGRWKGIYTQTVACDCAMGQMRACQMMPLRQYESLRPGWHYEYPMRKFERSLRELLSREEPQHREDKENHRRKIRWLQTQFGEVSEKQVEPWTGGSLRQLLEHCTKQIS